MTKAEASLKYDATRRSNNKWLWLFIGPFILVPLVTLAVGLAANRDIARGVYVILFVIAFSLALTYFTWRCDKEFTRNGLVCPSCGTPFDGRTIATCKCCRCGQMVLEDSDVPEQSRVLFSISYRTLFWILLVVSAAAFAIIKLR
jgi:hypothetical protein